ncbi:hypothetical protein JG688_00018294 [Phytophthora aleatoria]|uniref:Uncharacterized protein n=1 Tax=Phytophthora aleatoria TaxID=2496075 RepID=A0A8J5IFR3_9STRA|nr:hypothetical protein JG688_00018294 [Phytophthora aleatoria]
MSYKAVPIKSIPSPKLRKCIRDGKLSLSADALSGSSHTITLHPMMAIKVQKATAGKRGARSLQIAHDEIKYAMAHPSGKSVWKSVWSYAQKQFAKHDK